MSQRVLIIGGCGFVGSALFQHLQAAGYDVETVDLELFGNFIGAHNRWMDYRNLTAAELNSYDVIVHLAGHSSVRMANSDPRAALDNNLTGFFDLLTKLGDQKLIYASSASVYSGLGGAPADENYVSFRVANVYDFTKHGGDCMAAIYGKNYYALRFGTVNGMSPNIRLDVMINSMVRTALNAGKIEVANPNVHRSILGMGDLVRAVDAIIRGPSVPGVYNLASFSATVDEIAKEVGVVVGVPLSYGKPTATYDFVLDVNKFRRNFGFEFQETVRSITGQLRAGREQWRSITRGIR